MTGGLHHVEIYVSDLEASRRFWGWWLGELGWTIFQEWPEGFSYRLAETYLVFVQATLQDVTYHRKRVGLNHLAFHAADSAHVDRMSREIVARGCTLLYADRHPFAGGGGYHALFFEDPDRIKVELVAP